MRCGPHFRVNRSARIRRSVLTAVRFGETCGRDDRSDIESPARYRPTHFAAVVGDTWNRSAARRTVQPWSTTSRASLMRPTGVNGALA